VGFNSAPHHHKREIKKKKEKKKGPQCKSSCNRIKKAWNILCTDASSNQNPIAHNNIINGREFLNTNKIIESIISYRLKLLRQVMI
jgi:hypothetical protein